MILKDCENAGYKIICTFIVLYFNFEVPLTFLGTHTGTWCTSSYVNESINYNNP